MNRVEQPELATNREEVKSNGETAAWTPPGGSTFGRAPIRSDRTSIALHIGELVLHGFEPVNRYTIGGAVERELTRLLSEYGPPGTMTQDVDVEHMNFGVIHAKPGAKVEATGVQLARAIYRGLSK
ncbi:MAG TPA: hypothetical protein VF074_07225 [Pyrinomonadaceae bacterium]